MDQTLDDASYKEGRAAFAAGASIRSIVEECLASDTKLDEAKTFSAALGFADALLDVIRGLDQDRKPF
jgi:hypothetical protein